MPTTLYRSPHRRFRFRQTRDTSWLAHQLEVGRRLVTDTSPLLDSRPFDPTWLTRLEDGRRDGQMQPRCYAYALDRGPDGYVPLGHYGLMRGAILPSGLDRTPPFSVRTFAALTRFDGLVPVTEVPGVGQHPTRGWLVSSFLRPDGQDYHFKVLDADGGVSDKAGASPVRRTCEPGPEVLADLTRYSEPDSGVAYHFTGFHLVTRSWTQGR